MFSHAWLVVVVMVGGNDNINLSSSVGVYEHSVQQFRVCGDRLWAFEVCI